MAELPDAGTLATWDDRHLWHPFTPQSVYRTDDPLTVVGGEGHYLIDIDGRRYLDGVSSLWCTLLGHRRPEIDRAVTDQLSRIAHSTLLGHSHDQAILLAKRLAELAPPGLNRVFFSDNGSTAVEVAVKMALQYWQQTSVPGHERRTRFLSFGNAYHGDTVGAVSVGGIELFHSRFRPFLFEVLRAASPDFYHDRGGRDAKAAESEFIAEFDRITREHAEDLAGVILEPGMQGAGGMVRVPDGFLRHVRERTKEIGALLILDEVAMGVGRTGRMFACEHEGVVPDFLCLAKGLTGGYLPLAATLTTDEVYEAFLGAPEEGRTFFHGHTFTGNPLGCAAALAVLEIFEKDRLLDRLPQATERLAVELSRVAELQQLAGPARLASGRAGVGDTRQLGLAAGIELVADTETRTPFEPHLRIGHRVCRVARERGVFLRPLGDVVVLMPPLTITDREIGDLVGAVEFGIRSVLDN